MSKINYIYTITNTKNGKKYVGQTNNPHRRWKEHKTSSRKNGSKTLIAKKMRQYGVQNFVFEIVETIKDESAAFVDEREVHWIDFLRAHASTGEGYNLTSGGQCATINERKFGDKDVERIKNLLENGVEYNIISKEMGCSPTFISNINTGFYWPDENRVYPIFNYFLSDSTKASIRKSLIESLDSFREIAIKHGVSESYVKKVNYGSLCFDAEQTYPMRRVSGPKAKAEIVKKCLMETNLPFKEIENIAKVSAETVRRINLGLTHREKNCVYPLRKIVETISG